MWEKLNEIFTYFEEKYQFPYSRQGSYSENEDLPESFFTFWNVETPETRFYDNENHAVEWQWMVYFYTKNPSLIYSIPDEFVKKAKELDFIVKGRAKDIPSDEVDYLGRYLNLIFISEV